MYIWAALLSAGWYLLVSFQDAMGSEWSQNQKSWPGLRGPTGRLQQSPRTPAEWRGRAAGGPLLAQEQLLKDGHTSTIFLRQRVLFLDALAACSAYALLPARLFVVATTFSRFGQGQRDEGGWCRQSKNERGFSTSGQGGGSQDSIP